ncbi:MAG: acylphosphatase [Candidatus Methylomirabilales bacterium]
MGLNVPAKRARLFPEMDLQKASLKARVIGRVQGVGFRYFTERVADEIGVSGYVMNCHDGSVEVIAEGERKTLEELLWRLKQGPRGAQVDQVEETWGSYTGRFSGFAVRFWGG